MNTKYHGVDISLIESGDIESIKESLDTLVIQAKGAGWSQISATGNLKRLSNMTAQEVAEAFTAFTKVK